MYSILRSQRHNLLMTSLIFNHGMEPFQKSAKHRVVLKLKEYSSSAKLAKHVPLPLSVSHYVHAFLPPLTLAHKALPLESGE